MTEGQLRMFARYKNFLHLGHAWVTILEAFFRARMTDGTSAQARIVTFLFQMLAILNVADSWTHMTTRHGRAALEETAAIWWKLQRFVCLHEESTSVTRKSTLARGQALPC